MDSMDQVFSTVATQDAPIQETATQASEERKQKLAEMKASLKETIQTSPDYAQKVRRLSNSIKVVNTLGFGKGGNIVVDHKASTKDNRVLKQVSTVCGYILENIGEEPIEYKTEVFHLEGDKYVGEVVSKTWKPGEQIKLTRQYTTVLCAAPEISFTLANGKIVQSSKKNAKSIKEELSSYYFSFNKNEDGTTVQVNDDEVKLAVDDADGKVKPEYVETFGYLNNPKEGKTRTAGTKYTTQDMAANFVYKMMQEGGLV